MDIPIMDDIIPVFGKYEKGKYCIIGVKIIYQDEIYTIPIDVIEKDDIFIEGKKTLTKKDTQAISQWWLKRYKDYIKKKT